MSYIDRRTFIGGLTAMAGMGVISTASGSYRPPNILLIVADDLGWRDLGCYGNPDVHTPNIDGLAKDGVKFINAFVAAPSCSASRSSIMTGQAPHSVGVHGLTHVHPQFQMDRHIPTMARSLEDAGYHTAIQGKWHVATFKPVGRYGYQRRLSVMTIQKSDRARRFISHNRDRSWFIELNFMQTHRLSRGQFEMDPDFPVDPDKISVPDYWQMPDWPEIKEDVAKYYSQAARMDFIIGEILAEVERLGLSERTMVVFVSDNGPPYPGCKITCYDRGIGTPMIVRWPEGLPAGEERYGLVSTIDIMPTCLDAARLPIPGTVQGRSLLPIARGETDSVHDAVFAETTYHVEFVPARAIRTTEWKYIENLTSDPMGLDQNAKFEWAQRLANEPGQKCCLPRPPEELFNLVSDPYEQTNLADDPNYAAIKASLKMRLDEWRVETRDPYPDLE